jgi:hypothetical protein
MLNVTETFIEAGLVGKVLTVHDFTRVLGGSAASRYALINKALKKGELIQLKRGVAILHPKYNQRKLSKFYVACQMEPHSYISLESALSFHGWIPELVTVVSSVIKHGRTKSFATPLGEFHYHFIPIQSYEFLTGVVRERIEDQPFLMASPLRALMDYVYEKKIAWTGLAFLTDSLRIDIQNLIQLDRDSFTAIKKVYRSKRTINFLDKLEMALRNYE